MSLLILPEYEIKVYDARSMQIKPIPFTDLESLLNTIYCEFKISPFVEKHVLFNGKILTDKTYPEFILNYKSYPYIYLFQRIVPIITKKKYSQKI